MGFAAAAVLSKVGTLTEKGIAHRAGRAYSIVRSITDNVAALGEISVIMASGGGTRNRYLMERLAAHMPKGLRLTLSDEFGVPAAFKEAIKFAALAHASVNGLANNIPAASGAKRFGILGKLVQPPRLAKT